LGTRPSRSSGRRTNHVTQRRRDPSQPGNMERGGKKKRKRAGESRFELKPGRKDANGNYSNAASEETGRPIHAEEWVAEPGRLRRGEGRSNRLAIEWSLSDSDRTLGRLTHGPPLRTERLCSPARNNADKASADQVQKGEIEWTLYQANQALRLKGDRERRGGETQTNKPSRETWENLWRN